MNEIWQTALAVIGSFGGAGVIIYACSRWLANLTAEKMLRKTEFEFAKRLEDFKSQLENKNYISKVRFDLEIEIYRELSASTLEMVAHNNSLFPYGLVQVPQDEDKRMEHYQENYSKAVESFNVANHAILKNAPFMHETVFLMFDDIRKLCGLQVRMYRYYGDFTVEKDYHRYNETREKQRDEGYLRTKKIDIAMNNLLNELRKYIASLDVYEKA